MAKTDFKYNGIGFNGPHLAKMNYDEFEKHEKHHFADANGVLQPDGKLQMQELHTKLREKWPQAAAPAAATAAPAKAAEQTK